MSSPANSYDSFDRLYNEVTRALLNFVYEGRAKGAITSIEQRWFEQLILGFDAEFHAWDHPSNPDIRSYLALFESRGVSAALRLAAHAFLHVAYDLPRVIADNLSAYQPPQRIRLRSLFLRPAPLFRQVFMEQLRKGFIGKIRRPFAYLKPAEIAGYWLLSLRSVAWIHAETLADSNDRALMERQLARGLLAAGNAGYSVGGLSGVPRLDNSTMFQVAVPTVLTIEHPLAISLTALGLTSALAATAIARWHYQSKANRIAYFGARVYAEATKALQGREHAPPPGNPAFVEA